MMRVLRSDFKKVRPTADETADYEKKYEHKPSSPRAECLSCGTRIWYSGVGVHWHTRACSGYRTAPQKVIDFYRRAAHFTDCRADGSNVVIAQAFRPDGGGWSDEFRGWAASRSNIELLRRRGYTSVAFDLLDATGPGGYALHVADFQMREVA